jgi:hypothetical protein
MALNHLPKQIKTASAGSRDSLAHAEVSEGRRHVLVTRCRRRLEIRDPPPLTGAPSCDEAPLDTVGTRRPAGLKTSIYTRIDQLYGTISAVPSIYEAYQPDRRANTDSAAPLSPPLERAVYASIDTCEQL